MRNDRKVYTCCKDYSGREMETATQVQNLDGAICTSQSANIFGKGMNPTILPSTMRK